MRGLIASSLLFLAIPGLAQLEASLGIRTSYEKSGNESVSLAGPAIEINVGAWSAELFGESGSGRERFQLELRYPARPGVELMGGSRFERFPGETPDSDALFVGLRLHRTAGVLKAVGSARYIRSQDGDGFAAEVGIFIPISREMSLVGRPGRVQLGLAIERDQLDLGTETFRATRAAARLRFTMTQ